MMLRTKYLLLIVIINLLLSGHCYSDTNRNQLSRNPFMKPSFLNTTTDSTNINPKADYTLSDINLRATLSSDKHSIANVDGVMVFVGDKIKGYELIAVEEGSATFSKNGKKITLNVSEMHKKLK